MSGVLAGVRLLIAEDEFLLASELADGLAAEGGEIVAMVPSAAEAEDLAEGEIDGAILDVQLRDRVSFDVARRLRSRGIPFFFATGFADAMLPGDLKDVPLLTKPLKIADVVRQATAFAGKGRARQPQE